MMAWSKHIERSFNGGNNAIHVHAFQNSGEEKVVISVRIIDEDAWDGERSAVSFWSAVEHQGEMSEEQIIAHAKEIIEHEVMKMMRAIS